MASGQADKSFQLVTAFSLGSTNYITNGAAGARPFEYVPMVGCNHLSFTATVLGSAPTGNFTFEVNDWDFEQDIYRNSNWAPLNQPYTQTALSLPISAAANYNIQIPNLAAKFVRVKWNFTSGSGTLNAAVTCRAISR